MLSIVKFCILMVIAIQFTTPLIAQDKALYQRAEAGSASAQTELALWYMSQGRYKEGETWLKKAAKQGNSVAQFNLGQSYFNQHNDKEAIKMWKKAANQNHPLAQASLGKI